MASRKANMKSEERDELYRKVREIIEGWPDWKKEAYNNMFVVSKYQNKIGVKKDRG